MELSRVKGLDRGEKGKKNTFLFNTKIRKKQKTRNEKLLHFLEVQFSTGKKFPASSKKWRKVVLGLFLVSFGLETNMALNLLCVWVSVYPCYVLSEWFLFDMCILKDDMFSL